ncbi:NlpC/P60 domain-containing protein [Flavobacterium longum]|uniref:C40 family peptidase n=1 Tax=Flavobacterium longum TaxID=1299340 RepID=UPI0039EBB253
MQNKILLLFFVLASFTVQSQIVTSKKEAVKKGVYAPPAEKKPQVSATTAQPNTKTPATVTSAKPVAVTKPKVTAKPKKKRTVVVDEDNGSDLVIGPTENYLSVQMINNAMDFLGVHYRGGGTSRAGMDCSGMVTAVFNIFGMKLPRSSWEMAKVGEKIDPADAKKGDLVFFRTNGKSTINHVGMVIENDGEDITFIHSSTKKGVIISSTKEPYYKRTLAQANRVIM